VEREEGGGEVVFVACVEKKRRKGGVTRQSIILTGAAVEGEDGGRAWDMPRGGWSWVGRRAAQPCPWPVRAHSDRERGGYQVGP
jgi:hypothetical protein